MRSASACGSHVPLLRGYIPCGCFTLGGDFDFQTVRRLSLAFLSVQRRLGVVNGQKPNEQKTRLAGWSDSSLAQDGMWLSSTSLLIRLRPSLVPPVNTTCRNLPSRLP